MAKKLTVQDNAIHFGEKLAASGTFKTLFSDGMALVEETAAYLDGQGREDAKRLQRTAALVYATESMRLTTRLMQIASWLLLQRAVNEGEMTREEASSDKRRTRIVWQQTPTSSNPAEVLPPALLTLIATSSQLQDRLIRLDAMMSDPRTVARASFEPRPLETQMSRLRAAFCD